MARYGVNKVILIGNLGADPEIRHTRDNVAVANLRLATTERYRDRSEERRGGDPGAGRTPQEQGRGGQWQERTEWHNVVLWRALAETAERYLRKGSSVYIEGRLETRSWEDKSGQKRYTTEVVARDMIMLSGRGEGAAAGDDAAVPPPPDADDGPAPARPGNDGGQDDDLPF